MRRFFLFLVTSSLLFLTSCLEMMEDVFLNADGSGKYQVTMDMSELFSDPMLKGMIEEQAKKEAGQDADAPLEKDSTMFFRDAPGFEKLNAAEKELVKDVTVMMKASESKGEMIIKIDLPFKQLDDLQKIGEAMKKMDDGTNAGPAGMMSGGMFGSQGAQFALKKGVLTRLPLPDTKEMLGDDDDNLAMMKMFMSGASYKTVYHLPGKVKKTSIANAAVEGNTVTVENSFLDILEGKAQIAGDIKFKKK